MRRRRVFSTPFVITVSMGCGGKPVAESPSPPTPPPAADARTASRPSSAEDAAPRVSDPPPAIDAGPAIGSIVFRDPTCVRIEAAGETEVDCPVAALPDGGTALVVGHNQMCFRVHARKEGEGEWEAGRVRCPPGGPNVRLPSPVTIEVDEGTRPKTRYELDEESLTCRRYVYANPPYWVKAACPPKLLPELAGGLVPDVTGAACSYQGVAVACPVTPRDPASTTVRVRVSRPFDSTSLAAHDVEERVTAQYLAALKRCYLGNGAATIQLAVEPTGRTTVARVESAVPKLDACLQPVVAGWTFPIPRGADGKPARARFTIALDYE